MSEIVCAAISGICMIAVAIITRANVKSNKKAEARAELRQRESRLSMDMMDATLQLSVANCNALCGGHNNGNVEAAKTAAEKAKAAYDEFLREVAAHEVGK